MILTRAKETIKKYGLLNKGDKIVVGVSGGPDSIALLYLLDKLKHEFKLKLYVAHLDHMLRQDSFRDAEFVKKTADKLRIPARISRLNIKELTAKGSLEEIARNARLGFFFKVARQVKAKKVALGHTIDDQAETVLMRILRGTGLYGLSGILPKREIAGYKIIRPLIEIKKSEVEAFLKRKKITSRIDASNLEDIYFRNKIRNRLLPLLEAEYSRNIKGLLANMAQSAGCDYDCLLRIALRSMRRIKNKIALAKLKKLHPALQRIILRGMIAALKGNTRRITFRHMLELEDLVLKRPLNSIVDLPGEVSAVKRKSCLYFYRRKPPKE
ncbi:MAG: tRNA lysidine(34) synthetase TilS [Candidatus Omnitrophota bacterium]|nr:tRNA lysidine(34) synthetase TilS [Candidatus Omnitrophota bacterium]